MILLKRKRLSFCSFDLPVGFSENRHIPHVFFLSLLPLPPVAPNDCDLSDLPEYPYGPFSPQPSNTIPATQGFGSHNIVPKPGRSLCLALCACR